MTVNHVFGDSHRHLYGLQLFLLHSNGLHHLDILINEDPIINLDFLALLSGYSASNANLQPFSGIEELIVLFV